LPPVPLPLLSTAVPTPLESKVTPPPMPVD